MLDAWTSAFQKIFRIPVLRYLGLGLLNTIYIAAGAIVLSLFFGTLLGLLRHSKNRLLSSLAAVYIEIVRNIPLTLFIMMVRFMTPLEPVLSGIAAMSIFTSAIVAEIVRGGLNGIAPGQWEAAFSQGFGPVGTMWYIIIPQAIRKIRSPLVSQFVTTIKDTSFCAIVATAELSYSSKVLLAQQRTIGLRTAEDIIVLYLFIALIYYVITHLFASIARHEKKPV